MGSSDVHALVKNKSGETITIKIEVKIGKDRQSLAQKEYQKSIESVGGLYWIVKDFNMFLTLYDLIVND